MAKIKTLPQTIPVFPLPGALLLPRARLPLHIFEPRYLAMIEDTMKTPERLIGMVQPRRTNDDEVALHQIGCAGRLTAFSETEDGRYMITLSGISRFRVTAEREGFLPYRRCDVAWTGFERDLQSEESDPEIDRPALLSLLGRYFKENGMDTDWGSLEEAEPEMLVNSLSMMLPLEPEDKQALLETPTLKERRETLVALVEFALRSGAQDEVMQ